MTEKQHIKFLKDNVLPISLAPSKIKLEVCPENYLIPKSVYYTKNIDKTILKWLYTPCSKSYRSDMAKMVRKGLIYVEKTEDLVIFIHNRQLKMFK
tara:strand:- start:287 stop:574 length:288 start_codon:yes stop_codon:yes gene_type:complete